MRIELKFNKNFVDKLKDKIPQNVLDFRGEVWGAYAHGFIRFDNNLLNSIYIKVRHINENNSSALVKFDYVDGDFVYKYVYLAEDKNNEVHENRYDSKMNLDSKYIRFKYKNRTSVDGGELFCTKIEENNKVVNTNYIYYKEYKDFTNFFNFLEKKKMIINNDKLNNKCQYYVKQNSNIIYLCLTSYRITDKEIND